MNENKAIRKTDFFGKTIMDDRAKSESNGAEGASANGQGDKGSGGNGTDIEGGAQAGGGGGAGADSSDSMSAELRPPTVFEVMVVSIVVIVAYKSPKY